MTRTSPGTPVAWLDIRTAGLSWQNRIVATNPDFVEANGPENFVALYPHGPAQAPVYKTPYETPEVFRRLDRPVQSTLRLDELAAWLCALEDAECHKPVPESLVEHGRRYIRAGKTEKHSGDCTNECHSCVVCGTEGYLLHARQIIEALDPLQHHSPTGD